MVAGTPGEVNLRVTLNGFTSAAPGEHGIHIHTVGMCEAPGFTTAGGHFNPTTKKHGLNNPEGHHTGDMPNLVLSAGGSATYQTTVAGITLDAGTATSLFDADGSAVVIHTGPDDLMTDPAGNSGSRIACGVLTPASVPVAGMPRTGSATGNDSSVFAWLALAASMLAGGLLATRRTKRA
jgi:LPXTG-motif cell wall-anchored protein